jgi:HD-GYP domain-containing protein (c-di-GMP phosphodiesterase class II)
MAETKEKILVDNLVKGLYVDLELSWSQHPFIFARFRIKSDKDILVIKSLGLTEITVIPERSSVEIPNNTSPQEPIKQEKVLDEMWQSKNKKIEKANYYRDRRKKIVKRYHEQARKVKKITSEIRSQPANAIHNVDDVVEDLVSAFDGEGDLLTNLINLGSGDHSDYNHVVNVVMLSLMLAAEEKLSKDELQQLGVGALLHDIGKIEIPSSITMKTGKLTDSEAKILQRHPVVGRNLVERVRKPGTAALEIIEYHHELLDGTGYPRGLLATKLSKLVRIVSVANIYDNLCNPPDPAKAVTPKTALAMMYSKYKDKLDRHLVESFIHILGVYPPGTVVRLDDDSIGLVIATDTKAMLRPEVLLYNPDIPKEQALTINLKECDDLSIKDVLRPDEYPACIYEYLGIKERLGYLIESIPG